MTSQLDEYKPTQRSQVSIPIETLNVDFPTQMEIGQPINIRINLINRKSLDQEVFLKIEGFESAHFYNPKRCCGTLLRTTRRKFFSYETKPLKLDASLPSEVSNSFQINPSVPCPSMNFLIVDQLQCQIEFLIYVEVKAKSIDRKIFISSQFPAEQQQPNQINFFWKNPPDDWEFQALADYGNIIVVDRRIRFSTVTSPVFVSVLLDKNVVFPGEKVNVQVEISTEYSKFTLKNWTVQLCQEFYLIDENWLKRKLYDIRPWVCYEKLEGESKEAEVKGTKVNKFQLNIPRLLQPSTYAERVGVRYYIGIRFEFQDCDTPECEIVMPLLVKGDCQLLRPANQQNLENTLLNTLATGAHCKVPPNSNLKAKAFHTYRGLRRYNTTQLLNLGRQVQIGP